MTNRNAYSDPVQLREHRGRLHETARFAMANVIANQEHRSATEIFRERWPLSNSVGALQALTKTAVAAGGPGTWAGPLAPTMPSGLRQAPVEAGRQFSILGRLDDMATRAPFNVRVSSESSTPSGSGWLSPDGGAVAVIRGSLAATSLPPLFFASLAVMTDELARFGSEASVRYVSALLTRLASDPLDTYFCGDAAPVADQEPGGVLYGQPHISASGVTAAAAAADLQTLVSMFAAGGGSFRNAVFLLSSANAVTLALSGERAFENLQRDGGELGGCPAICSDAVGDRLILLDASRLLLADDESVDVDVSRQASIEMDSEPTQTSGSPSPSNVTSMFQTNSAALRLVRAVNWQVLDGAVAYIDEAS